MRPSARHLLVCGTVQGVGFRPFIYRLAIEHRVTGWVRNHIGGVDIHAEGDPDDLEAFETKIRNDYPPAASITSLRSMPTTPESFTRFEIHTSDHEGTPTTRISSDLAMCEDCRRELNDPNDHRAGYPYINCTNCGPRYSIIRSLPYDRPRTTMADWPLCDACRAEYEDPGDRRYHAQPVACPECGPGYSLVHEGAEPLLGPESIRRAASMLAEGRILAVKGLGGYHLACDATNTDAVRTLRERKFRKEKPFAIMTSSVESARLLVSLNETHLRLLTDIARPIVLAPSLRDLPHVAPDNAELGVMLPYTPVHDLFFAAGAPDPLVLTSANKSNEPIAYEDDDAFDRLADIADAFLIGERPIQRRVDDSVVSERLGQPFVIRRARGYAPASVASLDTDRPILAVGADLKNSIALAVGGEVFVSQHIGDLGDLDTERAFRETIDDLLGMYLIDCQDLIIAYDLHPEYYSSRAALSMQAAKHIAIQHHEAHIASVMLEHNLMDEPVVGLALDGTGFGHDGTIWGGEILAGSVAQGFTREASLTPVAMPGGDAAARCPVQACAAYLPHLDPAVFEAPPFGFPPRFHQAQSMVRNSVRTIPTTSAGRLFDAAAAVCGFTHEIAFEGQAAMWLEHLASRGTAESLEQRLTLDPMKLIERMVNARLEGVIPEDLAAWFHETLARSLRTTAVEIASRNGCSTLALSGGVWQNRLLLERFLNNPSDDLRVLLGQQVPVNDGGICVGQVALAARSSGMP